jgi:2-polyprenyl-3-methyl-5-hydroxy-6-metoxy-1,4-benzoquinol methylase
MERKEVETFYDAFSEAQAAGGVNQRHLEIMHRLRQAGLQKNNHVLEVGCGVGTLTGLLAKSAAKGTVLACDISQESLRMAQLRLADLGNIAYLHTDMLDFEHNSTFDWVVFPDVLEHIPVADHFQVLTRAVAHLKPGGRVAVHIPHPDAVAWYRMHQPETLQVIDQSLNLGAFIGTAESVGLRLLQLDAYALWHKPLDYVWILLEKPEQEFQPIARGRFAAWVDYLKYRLGRLSLFQ